MVERLDTSPRDARFGVRRGHRGRLRRARDPDAARRRIAPPRDGGRRRSGGRVSTGACDSAAGTVDGGDVLVAGRHVFVGRSSRTNEAAVGQMRQLLEPFGYTVSETVVRSCLHLKSAVTALSDDVLAREPGVDRSGGVRGVHARRGRSVGAAGRERAAAPRSDRRVVGVSAHRRAHRAAWAAGCTPSTRARSRKPRGR